LFPATTWVRVRMGLRVSGIFIGWQPTTEADQPAAWGPPASPAPTPAMGRTALPAATAAMRQTAQPVLTAASSTGRVGSGWGGNTPTIYTYTKY
jgi:hypothetical protein